MMQPLRKTLSFRHARRAACNMFWPEDRRSLPFAVASGMLSFLPCPPETLGLASLKDCLVVPWSLPRQASPGGEGGTGAS
eukprot:7893863-Lingulodinium_polyedra.AAC.1